MKLSRQQFLGQPKKAVTLIGMSGVGKTYLSGMLEGYGWTRYSCDYEIGTKYLMDALSGAMKNPEDMDALFKFIGMPGDPKKGGHMLAKYKKHQKAYYDAECQSVAQAALEAEYAAGHFVHDSTGSLCEIIDEDLLARLGARTLFVYLRASAAEEQMVLERAISHPKPLFFPPERLDGWIADYLAEHHMDHADQMDPQAYTRWVFPRLFASRLPKYQRLAELYGVTMESADLHGVASADDFIQRVAARLHD